VKQLAFYQQTPKDAEMSRAIRLQLTGEKPVFPKLSNEAYLLQYLDELDFGQYQNGSLMPLDYPKIESWKNLSGIDISFQEIKALIKLSTSYTNTLHQAKETDFKQPYIKE